MGNCSLYVLLELSYLYFGSDAVIRYSQRINIDLCINNNNQDLIKL